MSTAAPTSAAASASDQAFGAAPGEGVRYFNVLVQHGTATPEAVAKLVHMYPQDRNAIFEAAKLELDLPEDFVAQVQQAEQKLPAAPATPDAGKTGSAPTGSAPAAKAKPYSDGVSSWGAYSGTSVPVTDPSKTVAPGVFQDGELKLDPVTATTSANGTTTTTTTNKTIAPEPDNIVDGANALRDYRAKVSAALDEQIAGVSAKTKTSGYEGEEHKKELVDQLNAAKDKAKNAQSIEELDHLVAANKLLVIPPEAVLKATTTTTTKTASAGAVFDGGTVLGASAKKTTYDAMDPQNPGQNVQTTRSASIGVGTKGLDASASTSTTKTDQDTGAASTTAWKLGASGGITDPAQVSASRKTDKTEGNVTLKAGDGTGTLGAGFKTLKDDGTQNLGVSGNLGVTQGPTGSGVSAGVEGRKDTGDKEKSSGVYGAADGSVTVMVSGDDTIGYTLTFTASSRIRLGEFAGNRAPETPKEVGNDKNWSGGATAGRNHVVTRTKKLSKDEMQKLIPELDKLASGRTPDGKKAYGAEAAYKAYTAVFGGNLEDVFLNPDIKAGKGESISVANETTVGGEAKGDASTGDSKGSRSSVNASGGGEIDFISGFSESNDNGIVTRSIRTGDRVKGNLSVGGGFGSASGKVGVTGSDEQTKTYIFNVPEANTALLEKVRAIKTKQDAEQFAKDHPETIAGNVTGNVTSSGSNVSASAGPVSASVGTTKTLDQNIAATTHKDANGKDVKDLSGTIGGKQEGTADVSLLNVKLYQEKTTAESKGTVDPNGQASLDVTTTTSSSNAVDAYGKNKADLDATRTADKALIVATGGPMGYVKRLAERVGEQSTVGAHFDNQSFEAIKDLAHDHARWMKAADTYRDEWSTLGRELVHPNPPAEWKAQDESPDKQAAYQLARMKAFAEYMQEAGPHGTDTVQRLRSQFNGDRMNVLGATVSWPPSLQSKRPDFDAAAQKVEHLEPTMKPYAENGDRAGGNAYLDKLLGDLETLKLAIANAPDHENAQKGVEAANGVAQMQDKVRGMKERFRAAVTAHDQKKAKTDVDAALADPKSQAHELYVQQEQLKKQIAEHDKASAAAPLPKQGDAKAWAEHDKAVANQGGSQDDKDKLQALHDQETKAREDEAVVEARNHLQTFHETCIYSRDSLYRLTFKAKDSVHFYSNSDAMALVGQMRGMLEKWQAQWKTYNDACTKTGDAPDMTVLPRLSDSMKQNIDVVKAKASDFDLAFINKLYADWS